MNIDIEEVIPHQIPFYSNSKIQLCVCLKLRQFDELDKKEFKKYNYGAFL